MFYLSYKINYLLVITNYTTKYCKLEKGPSNLYSWVNEIFNTVLSEFSIAIIHQLYEIQWKVNNI